METKDLAAGLLLLMAIPAATLVCCFSHRMRELAFFAMIAGTALTDKLDVNLFSRYWYRGTTRGFEFTFVDVLAMALLLSCMLFPRKGQPRWFWPGSLGIMFLFAAYAAFSVVVSEPKMYGLYEFAKILRGIVIFLAVAWYVRGERELMLLLTALALAVCLQGALCVKQRVLSDVYRVTGTLDHSNSLSMYLCLTAPLLVVAGTTLRVPVFVRWLSMAGIGLATIAIVFTISRAGIPIFALIMLATTAFCISWRITLQKLVVTAVGIVFVCGIFYKSWDIVKDRFLQASFEKEYLEEGSGGRGMYLRQAGAIIRDNVLGVGLNNWSYWVSKTYGHRLGEVYEDYDDLDYIPDKETLAAIHYAAPAHNLAALTIGELGVPGLMLFGLLWVRWFHMSVGFLWRRSQDLLGRVGIGLFFGISGVFLQSLTEWTFRQTQIYLMMHALLGVLAALYHYRRKARVASRQMAMADAESEASTYAPVPAGSW